MRSPLNRFLMFVSFFIFSFYNIDFSIAQLSCSRTFLGRNYDKIINSAAFDLFLDQKGRPNWLNLDSEKNPALFLERNWKKKEIRNSRFENAKILRKLESGMLNNGIYFIQATDGSVRVVKVLLLSGEKVERAIKVMSNKNRLNSYRAEAALEDAFAEIHGAYLAESLGGPKVYTFGTVTQINENGKIEKKVYLELENVFSGEKSFNFKSLRGMPFETLGSLVIGSRVVTEIAVNLVKAAEFGVVPRDPDFLISEEGMVRWIDSGQWYKEIDRDRFLRGSFGNIINQYVQEFKNSTSSNVIQLGRLFLIQFLINLKKSSAFTETQKEILVRSIFSRFEGLSNLAELARQEDIRILKNLEFILKDDISYIDPAEIVVAKYKEL